MLLSLTIMTCKSLFVGTLAYGLELRSTGHASDDNLATFVKF